MTPRILELGLRFASSEEWDTPVIQFISSTAVKFGLAFKIPRLRNTAFTRSMLSWVSVYSKVAIVIGTLTNWARSIVKSTVAYLINSKQVSRAS